MVSLRDRLVERRFGKLLTARACGDCTAWCTVAAGEELAKNAEESCRHRRANGCAIYESRPNACSTFYCGWRRMKALADNL